MRRRVAPSILLGLALLLTGCASSPPDRPRTAFPTPTDAQANGIAMHAMGLVGTPYRYGGNTPASGFDCSGLIGYVFKAGTGTAPPRTVAQLAGFGAPVSVGDARAGDLVFFGGKQPSHAGIFVGEGRFVHAPSTGGKVRLDRLDNVYWKQQSPSFRRP